MRHLRCSMLKSYFFHNYIFTSFYPLAQICFQGSLNLLVNRVGFGGGAVYKYFTEDGFGVVFMGAFLFRGPGLQKGPVWI